MSTWSFLIASAIVLYFLNSKVVFRLTRVLFTVFNAGSGEIVPIMVSKYCPS